MIYSILDLETTTIKAEEGEIFEIGAMICDTSFNVLNRFHHLVKIQDKKALDEIIKKGENKAVVNYNEEKWDKEGFPIDVVLSHLYELVRSFHDDRCVIVGHNPSFDISFLKYNCEKHKIRYPFDHLFLDTISLCLLYDSIKGITRRGYALSSITRELKIKHINKHTSMGDVDAVYNLIRFFRDNMGSSVSLKKQGELKLE